MIIHIDGDSFFASCEVALDPKLRGKPVVTGLERGIASAMSYEAKKKGVTRGMTVREIRKICPNVIILPSDYEMYSLFSKRMFSIARNYVLRVEEYSIDECFAEVSGDKDQSLNTARVLKSELERRLGISFSVGVASTKGLAKLGSKLAKPAGCVFVDSVLSAGQLDALPIEKVWGIGPQTSAYLRSVSVKSVYDFMRLDEYWVRSRLSKPFVGIWHELNGRSIYSIHEGEVLPQSVSKTKTFTPPSSDKGYVFSQLSRNIENACIKLRRVGAVSDSLYIYLKTSDFAYYGENVDLPDKSSSPKDMVEFCRPVFNRLFRTGITYRATGVVAQDLVYNKDSQQSLFPDPLNYSKLWNAIDSVDRKFGKHTIFLASSMAALKRSHVGERGAQLNRGEIFPGEGSRKRVGLPYMGEVC